MNKILSILSLILILNLSSTAKKKIDLQSIDLKNWLQSEAVPVLLPAFHKSLDIENKSFQLKDLLIQNYIDLEKLRPEENDILKWNQLQIEWHKADLSKKEYLNTNGKAKYLNYYATYIDIEDWSKAKLIVQTFPMLEIYLDGKKVASHYKQQDKEVKELTSNLDLSISFHRFLAHSKYQLP